MDAVVRRGSGRGSLIGRGQIRPLQFSRHDRSVILTCRHGELPTSVSVAWDFLPMDEPITQWINQLRQSEPEAAQQLWDHYCERLYALARNKLTASGRRVYDEEDAAVSAFHSLCRGIAAHRYPELNDRDNLWRLLVTITARKVAARHRHEGRDKRDSDRLLTESAFMKLGDAVGLGLDGFAGREPTPEFAAEVAETCDLLFAALDDSTLRRITELKLEGFTNGQISKQLGCTRRTVERKLERIRRLWNGFVPE